MDKVKGVLFVIFTIITQDFLIYNKIQENFIILERFWNGCGTAEEHVLRIINNEHQDDIVYLILFYGGNNHVF